MNFDAVQYLQTNTFVFKTIYRFVYQYLTNTQMTELVIIYIDVKTSRLLENKYVKKTYDLDFMKFHYLRSKENTNTDAFCLICN